MRIQASYVLRAALLMGLLYAVAFYPFPADSVADRALAALLRLQAACAGALIGVFDSAVRVQGTTIQGRFPLEIVRSCSSLDAQALFVAAVLAFPARGRRKLIGLALGVSMLMAFNLARIAGLYFVGADAPELFDSVHEELFPLVLVLIAALLFWGWAQWAHHEAARASLA